MRGSWLTHHRLLKKYAAYFNSLIALLLGFFVYLNGPLKKQNILLFLLSASIALYAIFFALSIYARNPALSLLEVRIFHLFAAFIATFFYLFANEIIFGNTFKRPLHFLPLLTGILTAYFLLKGDVVRGVERIGNLPNWTVPGSYFIIYLLFQNFRRPKKPNKACANRGRLGATRRLDDFSARLGDKS